MILGQQLKRLRQRLQTALANAKRDAESDSALCRHDGRPPLCLNCTSAYLRMP